MKDILTKRMPLVLWVLFVWLTFQMLTSWVFVRFVHYDSQYRVLEPDTYQATILSPEDYALLQDSTKESVTLSDGSTYSDRQPSFYQYVVPSYKPIGEHYLLVKTFGTSHYYHRWITDMVPLMIPIVLGVIAATLHYRRQTLATESDRE